MLTFYPRVNKGKIPNQVSLDIKSFIEANEGKILVITLKKLKSQRSLSQNNYYWAGVIPIVKQGFKDIGYILTNEEVHTFLKDKFIEAEAMVTEEGVLLGYKEKKTSTLNKTQFGEYISAIQQWSAEILGVVIPDPEQQTEML